MLQPAPTTTNAALKAAASSPFLSQGETSNAAYPISTDAPAVTGTTPQPLQSAPQGRPTLTAGLAAGRISGTWVWPLSSSNTPDG